MDVIFFQEIFIIFLKNVYIFDVDFFLERRSVA